MILCYLCLALRERVDNRQLSNRWHTNKSNISQQLKFYLYCFTLTWFSKKAKVRELNKGVFEVHISCSSDTSFTYSILLSIKGKMIHNINNRFGIIFCSIFRTGNNFDNTTNWNQNNTILCRFSVLICRLSRKTILCLSFFLKSKIQKSIVVTICLEDNRPSMPSVPSIWSSIKHSCFTSSTRCSISSLS